VTGKNSPRRVFIAQISDLHVKPVGTRAYQRVDTAAALARCVKELNRFAPRPDIVVISGDLVDAPSQSAYDHLVQLLYGTLDADALAWLEAALAASPTRAALLFLHHPPFITGIGHMDVQSLRNAGDLAAILRRHRRARLVAAGHVHRAILTSFANAAATICPAPNHAVALDLDGRLPPSFTIEPPAFHLHVWRPGENFGSVVTHWVPIGDFDGPHRFHDDRGQFL
jgi:3',5'-cyclic AMP phosphodiesterase CpdA